MGQTAADHEREVAEGAVAFSVVAFRGRGVYDRREVPTLADARAAAGGMKTDRPVGIYAIGADGRAVHVENV
jgi:hypothetical protein